MCVVTRYCLTVLLANWCGMYNLQTIELWKVRVSNISITYSPVVDWRKKWNHRWENQFQCSTGKSSSITC